MIDRLLEKNLLPDSVVRFGIRRLLGDRIREEAKCTVEAEEQYVRDYVADLSRRSIAEQTDAANDQHYEVPASFYLNVLGNRLKYSSCYFPNGDESLDQGEEAMLELYAKRAQIQDGQNVLELGCGWGSCTLYLAEKFPGAQITGVSNSQSQRSFIEARARGRGLRNVRIITCDMNKFEAEEEAYDRVVSIEMFEHMKNYRQLMSNISRWLKPDGKLFVHIFTHHRYPYHFVSKGPSDWMSRYFFTGGQMPSHDLLMQFQEHLRLDQDWRLNGRHYQRTAELWLQNMDAAREKILPVFADTYGVGHERKWWSYWRIFFMSCAELWGYRGGHEWLVSHYLFSRRRGP